MILSRAKNFDHCEVWIKGYMQHFAAAFGIDLLGYPILSNYFHLILRTRTDVVATWDDREVARRCLMLCPHRRIADSAAMPPTQPEINSIAGCPIKCVSVKPCPRLGRRCLRFGSLLSGGHHGFFCDRPDRDIAKGQLRNGVKNSGTRKYFRNRNWLVYFRRG